MAAYLSAREAAAYCGVSDRSIRNWLRTGQLSADVTDGVYRIPREQLDALRRKRARSPRRTEVRADVRADQVRTAPQGLGPAVDVTALVELLRQTQAELVVRSEAAAMWQTRAEMLGTEVSQLRALQAPAAAVAVASAPARRSWWRPWSRSAG